MIAFPSHGNRDSYIIFPIRFVKLKISFLKNVTLSLLISTLPTKLDSKISN